MKNIPFSPPDITEKEVAAVCEVLRSGWITTGPKCKLFEQKIAEFCGACRAACLSSATAGLECILRILGIRPGDEVIVPAYTYTATAAAAFHCGAKIVMCDTAPGSFFMDYDKLQGLITKRTKAVIAVDIGGKMCDYVRIFEICEQKRAEFSADTELQKNFGRVAVIADAAHSFGAVRDGVMSGAAADFTAFSFHAVKNLTTGEGGAVTWSGKSFLDDDELYKSFMLQSLHGQSKDALAKTEKSSWEYDVVSPLYKCNMTDIAAAIGIAQLERYLGMLAKRRKYIEMYDKAFLADDRIVPLVHFEENISSSGHLYMINISGIAAGGRNEIIEKLSERGVAANVHYKPLPMLTAYKKLGFDAAQFPNASAQFSSEITLPLNTKMSEDDVAYVAQNVLDILRDY